MIDAGITCVLALLVTLLCGSFMIPMLRRMKVEQSILEDGPRWHMAKQGTPTMGGFLFMTGVSVAVVTLGWKDMVEQNYAHLFVLAFAWIYGIIGFVDDYAKVKKKQNKGLTALQKLLLQLAAAAAFISLLRFFGYTTSEVYLPFFNLSFALPWLVYLILAILGTAAVVNGVNFTDGVDGLCASATLPVAVFFVFVGLQWQQTGVVTFSAALAGGLIGFLCYNFHPAKVFMGDTGSLFIGGALCGLAFVIDTPLVILIVGLVYVLELLSVVLQVLYFRATGGKRLFKMSPLHHHFEMSGWKERSIALAAFSLSVLCCVLGWISVCGRYPGL